MSGFLGPVYDKPVLLPQSPFYFHNRAIYILRAEPVHPLNVPFTHAVKTVTRCGSRL